MGERCQLRYRLVYRHHVSVNANHQAGSELEYSSYRWYTVEVENSILLEDKVEIFLSLDTWISLLALSIIEIILGIDNLVIISLLTNRLHQQHQKIARRVGLFLALIMRLGLLGVIFWLAKLTQPILQLGDLVFSIRDITLICGGIFLLIKATQEIIACLRPEPEAPKKSGKLFWLVILQIMFFDVLFSLDSVITAVGIAKHYEIMAAAIILAVILMMVASEPLSRFIMSNVRIKMLALCILLFVGAELVLVGFNVFVSPEYVFVVMGFGLFYELLNMRVAKATREAE
ncbi:MAG: TerC family protein [Gammaproteobacteria bacterium]|nr:TerC family protein [Gammaproteobacteria bacterium]